MFGKLQTYQNLDYCINLHVCLSICRSVGLSITLQCFFPIFREFGPFHYTYIQYHFLPIYEVKWGMAQLAFNVILVY